MTWEFTCPICQSDEVVIARGPKTSPVLILGDRPGQDEAKEGKPFVGATGGVLKSELARLGVDLNKIRITNLWTHPPNKNPECFELGAKKAIAEAIGRKVILLIGSEPVKYFAHASVEEYNGLIVLTDFFPDAVCLACIQPASAFHGSLGEVRFALQSFATILKKKDLL